MNCSVVQKKLSLILDGEVSPEDLSDLESHLEECSACSRLFSEWSEIKEIIRTMPKAQLSTDFDRSLKDKLNRATVTNKRSNRFALWAVAASIIVAMFWTIEIPEPSIPHQTSTRPLMNAGVMSERDYCNEVHQCQESRPCSQFSNCGLRSNVPLDSVAH